jgi:transposase InsO family protein
MSLVPSSPGVSPNSRPSRAELLGQLVGYRVRRMDQRIGDWRTEYNSYRPHAALGMLTPAEFADQWRPTDPPNLS